MKSVQIGERPTISVITVTLNADRTLERTIHSVGNQTFPPEEYLIIDGGSTDGTQIIARNHADLISRFVSGIDEGIFDAMNQGLALAKSDVVGFLNADDVYSDSAVLASVRELLSDPNIDAVFGDLDYVNKKGRIVRRWRSRPFAHELLKSGWMPPHPTFYCRRDVLASAGGFRRGYAVAGDYELFLRLFAIRHLRAVHLPRVMVRMESGGTSNGSLAKVARGIREVQRAWRDNGLSPPPFVGLRKVASKIPQLWRSADTLR